jgi:hypothetical protein
MILMYHYQMFHYIVYYISEQNKTQVLIIKITKNTDSMNIRTMKQI